MLIYTCLRSASVKPEESDADTNETAIEDETGALLEGISAADIIAAVSETADTGISMITKWLGINLAAAASNATVGEVQN